MRLEKIINLFKQIDKFAKTEEVAFIEFITKEIPSLWDVFQKNKSSKSSSDHFEDDIVNGITQDPYPEHKMD